VHCLALENTGEQLEAMILSCLGLQAGEVLFSLRRAPLCDLTGTYTDGRDRLCTAHVAGLGEIEACIADRPVAI